MEGAVRTGRGAARFKIVAGPNVGTSIAPGATATFTSAAYTITQADVDAGTGLAPVILRTANGATPARTGSIDELRVGNIVDVYP